MIEREAKAVWTDDLENGEGDIKSDFIYGSYSHVSRFENGDGASPEELIGDAPADFYSMTLVLELDQTGYTPVSVCTRANVHIDSSVLVIEN